MLKRKIRAGPIGIDVVDNTTPKATHMLAIISFFHNTSKHIKTRPLQMEWSRNSLVLCCTPLPYASIIWIRSRF